MIDSDEKASWATPDGVSLARMSSVPNFREDPKVRRNASWHYILSCQVLPVRSRELITWETQFRLTHIHRECCLFTLKAAWSLSKKPTLRWPVWSISALCMCHNFPAPSTSLTCFDDLSSSRNIACRVCKPNITTICFKIQLWGEGDRIVDWIAGSIAPPLNSRISPLFISPGRRML